MRRAALLAISAVCVALAAAGCGGSSHGRARTDTIAVLSSTVPTRTAPTPPSPAEIRRAAELTAAKPGFRATVHARITVPQFGRGNPLTAVGSGYFDPASGTGTLNLAITLPGLLSLVGPLPAQVVIVGGQAYVQVPQDVQTELGLSESWLEVSLSALDLGGSLSPPVILDQVARDATKKIPGQRATVTVDPSTGLVRTIFLTYREPGYRVSASLRLTGFTKQSASQAPPSDQVGELSSVIHQLGL